MSLYDLARDLTYKYCGNDLCVGGYFIRSGVPIKIIYGQFMGEYGLSNHWHWKEVRSDGLGSEKTGYGGKWPEITEQEANNYPAFD